MRANFSDEPLKKRAQVRLTVQEWAPVGRGVGCERMCVSLRVCAHVRGLVRVGGRKC